MNVSLMNLKARLRQDSGENSIMQTISIAVSAILIAAGLITAPSLINNARDVNARTDLASIAYGEEFANSNTGGYLAITNASAAPAVGAIATFQNNNGTTADGAVKTTLSAGTEVGVVTDTAKGFVAIVKSASGNYFARTANSATIANLGKTLPAFGALNTTLGGAALTALPVMTPVV